MQNQQDNNEHTMQNILKFLDNNKTARKIDNINMYQVQGQKDFNIVKVVKMGVYHKIPCSQLLKIKQNDLTCILMSLLIDDIDVQNNNFKMIGFYIQKDDNIIASLDVIFRTNEENKTCNSLSGHFEIVLNYNNKESIIQKIENYCGNDNIIYLLTTVLIEDVIHKIS